MNKISLLLAALLMPIEGAQARGLEITSCEELNDILQEDDLRIFYPIHVNLEGQDCAITSISNNTHFSRDGQLASVKANKLSFIVSSAEQRSAPYPRRSLHIVQADINELDLRFDPFTWTNTPDGWQQIEYGAENFLYIRSGKIGSLILGDSTLVHVDLSNTLDLDLQTRRQYVERKAFYRNLWQDGRNLSGTYLPPFQYAAGVYSDVNLSGVEIHRDIDLSNIELIRARFSNLKIRYAGPDWYQSGRFSSNLLRSDILVLSQPKLENKPEHRLSTLRNLNLSDKDLSHFDFQSQVIQDQNAAGTIFHRSRLDGARLTGIANLQETGKFQGASFSKVEICADDAIFLLQDEFSAENALTFYTIELDECKTNMTAQFKSLLDQNLQHLAASMDEEALQNLLIQARSLQVQDRVFAALLDADLLTNHQAMLIAARRGISLSYTNSAIRDLVLLLAQDREANWVSSVSFLAQHAMDNFKADFSLIWQKHAARIVAGNDDDIALFLAEIDDSKMSNHLQTLSDVMLQLEGDLKAAARGISLKAQIDQLQYTQKLLGLFSLQDIHHLSGYSQIYLALQGSGAGIDRGFDDVVLRYLGRGFESLTRDQLRREMVEFHAVGSQQSLVSQNITFADQFVRGARSLFVDRQNQLDRNQSVAQACIEGESVSRSIDTVKRNRQSSKLQMQNLVDSYESQIADMDSQILSNNTRIDLMQVNINRWCRDHIKPAVPLPGIALPLPDDEQDREKCRKLDLSFGLYFQFFSPFGNFSEYRPGVSDEDKLIYLAYRTSILDLRIQNESLQLQIANARLQLQRSQQLQVATDKEFEFEVDQLNLRLDYWTLACESGSNDGLSHQELNDLIAKNLQQARQALTTAWLGNQLLRQMLGWSYSLGLREADLEILPADRPFETLQRYEDFLRALAMDWDLVRPNIFSLVDSEISYVLVPLFPGFWNSREPAFNPVKSHYLAELDQISRWVEGRKLQLTPAHLEACVSDSIFDMMDRVDRSLPFDPFAPQFQPSDGNQTVLSWNQMPYWYGNRIREASSQTFSDQNIRDDIRRAWALWKFHRTYQRYWQTFRDLNAAPIPEYQESELSFKLGADLFEGAEFSPLVGFYPASIISTLEQVSGSSFFDQYQARCHARSQFIHDGAKRLACSDRYRTNFNLKQNQNFDDYDFNEHFANVRSVIDGTINFRASNYLRGINLAGELRGSRPIFDRINITIESLARRNAQQPSYGGTYLAISYLKTSYIDQSKLMDWRGNLPIPRPEGDEYLSDIYFPEREDYLFNDQSPLSWLFDNSSSAQSIESCQIIKDELRF